MLALLHKHRNAKRLYNRHMLVALRVVAKMCDAIRGTRLKISLDTGHAYLILHAQQAYNIETTSIYRRCFNIVGLLGGNLNGTFDDVLGK